MPHDEVLFIFPTFWHLSVGLPNFHMWLLWLLGRLERKRKLIETFGKVSVWTGSEISKLTSELPPPNPPKPPNPPPCSSPWPWPTLSSMCFLNSSNWSRVYSRRLQTKRVTEVNVAARVFQSPETGTAREARDSHVHKKTFAPFIILANKIVSSVEDSVMQVCFCCYCFFVLFFVWFFLVAVDFDWEK